MACKIKKKVNKQKKPLFQNASSNFPTASDLSEWLGGGMLSVSNQGVEVRKLRPAWICNT